MRRNLPILSSSGICLGLLLTVCAVAPAAGQTTERHVYVTVTNDDDERAEGLTPADFRVREGGREREITAVEPATERMRMAILVEESLTPTGGVRMGLAEFIQRMQPHAEMSLMVMSLRNMVIVDYTTDVSALFAGINSFSLYRHQQQLNNVPEGVYEAARKFEEESANRPVMVVVAQELMQESSEIPYRVLDQIGRSGVLVEVVTVESGQSNIAVGDLGDMSGRAQILGDGSRQSGGQKIEVNALTAVPGALQQLADGLLSQYRITYILPEGTDPSNRLNVDLRRRGLSLRAPTRVAVPRD